MRESNCGPFRPLPTGLKGIKYFLLGLLDDAVLATPESPAVRSE